MKEKIKTAAKTALNVGCIVLGMAIAGFGFKNLLPKKGYSHCEVPKKEID